MIFYPHIKKILGHFFGLICCSPIFVTQIELVSLAKYYYFTNNNNTHIMDRRINNIGALEGMGGGKLTLYFIFQIKNNNNMGGSQCRFSQDGEGTLPRIAININLRCFTLKKDHIGLVVSEILRYRQTVSCYFYISIDK